MRLSVAALRDVAAERRAKERAEAPTVKTEEQTRAEEYAKAKAGAKPQSIWHRRFRPLPEAKAVDLFAEIIGDAFILTIGTALVIYEYVRTKSKPDGNAIKIAEMEDLLREEQKRIEELEQMEKQRQERMSVLEQALEAYKGAKENQKHAAAQ